MHYSLVGGSQGSSVVFEAEELISNRWPDYPSSCEWSDAPVKPTFLAINSAVTNLDIPSRPYVDGSGETNDQYASYMDGGPGYDPTGGVKGNEGNIAEMWATGLSTTGTGCGFNLGINDCGATATCHISFDAFGRWRPLGATAELTMVQDNTALSCLSNGPGTCFNIPNQTNTAGYVITGDCDQVTMPGTQQQFVARHGNLMQRVFAGAPHGVTRRCAGDNGWDECAASPAGSVYFADPVIHDGKYDPVPK